jgi:uncharacterized protein YbcI
MLQDESSREKVPVGSEADVLRQISRAMVRLYKEHFGRGPESVSTHFSGPDAIVSILGNSLTPVERSLRDLGSRQQLRNIRLMFQHASEEDFRSAVEAACGRKVIGFTSGIDIDHDLSSEVFVLEPRSQPSRGDTAQDL